MTKGTKEGEMYRAKCEEGIEIERKKRKQGRRNESMKA
jgi:hypothetical protein